MSSANTTLDDITEAMKDVIDPELGINVIDLGLVYDMRLDENNVAILDMTLTSAACPLQDVIEDQTHQVLADMVPLLLIRSEKDSTILSASSKVLPVIKSLAIDVLACEIEQPTPSQVTLVTIPSEIFTFNVISSPQLGLT